MVEVGVSGFVGFVERLSSRKWLLALGSCVFFAFVHAYDNLAQVVVAYLAVEAGVDALSQFYQARQGSPKE